MVASAFLAEEVFRFLGDSASMDLKGLYTAFGNRSYKLSANVDTDASWSAGHFSVHTDSLGLRCDKARLFGVKPGDSVDVVFMGDSQGFGNGVNFEETIAGRVAVEATGAGRRVANCAVGGHTLRNQEELLGWLQERSNVKTTAAYVVLLTPSLSLHSANYTHAEVGADGRLYGKSFNALGRLVVWFKTHAVSYARMRDALHNSGLIPAAENTPQVLQLYRSDVGPEQARQSLLSVLKELQERARAQGASLFLAYVPLALEADFSSLTKVAEQKGMALNRDRPLNVCVSVAKELGVPLWNLRPVLEELRAKGHPLSLKGDPHYAPGTSAACGNELWSELELFLDKPHNDRR